MKKTKTKKLWLVLWRNPPGGGVRAGEWYVWNYHMSRASAEWDIEGVQYMFREFIIRPVSVEVPR